MNLLAIFAHPDDEAFSCGGTLARYAAEGHQVHLICATRGEEGEIVHPDIDPSIPKGDPRGKLREGELQAACDALGIHAPIFLEYHDSGFPIEVGLENPRALINADLATLERELLPHIAQLEPDVIITFDPHGMYGHIDHVMVHRAAIAAFWSAGGITPSAPKRLFFPMRSIREVEHLKANVDSTTINSLEPKVYGVSEDSFAAQLGIEAYLEQKRAGLAAHRSQLGPESRIDEMIEVQAGRFTQERFVLGGLRGSFPTMPVTDLFAGLE